MKNAKLLRFRRPKPTMRRGATTRSYTTEWYPGAPLKRRLEWRHEPDHERWASMDYDARWTLTVILEPWRLERGASDGCPLSWDVLLEKWRSYKKEAG